MAGRAPDALTAGVWTADHAEAVARARRLRRLLVIQFVAAGRPLCQEMEAQTLNAPEVLRLLLAGYVAVKLDAEARGDLFADLVGGRGALATVVVDGTGDAVAARVGFLAADEYVRFLSGAAEHHGALSAVRRAAERAPRDPARLLALAETYDRGGSQLRAEQTRRKVLALAPASAPAAKALATSMAAAHERLARLEVVRGRNREARAHLEAYRGLQQALGSGSSAPALLTEGLVLMVERRVREGREVLEELLRRHPATPEMDHVLFALGMARHELKDDAAALAALEQVQRQHPGSRFAAAARQQIEHIRNPVNDHVH